MPRTTWYGDESYDAHDGKCSVVVALVRPVGDPEDVRAALRDLVLRPNGYLHFYEEGAARRRVLTTALGALPIEAAIAVRAGTAAVERARSRFLGKGDDPLSWLPDLVAGAALQAFARHVPHYLQALEPVIRRIDQ